MLRRSKIKSNHTTMAFYLQRRNDEKKILEYINEASEVEKQGLKMQDEKFKLLPVPE